MVLLSARAAATHAMAVSSSSCSTRRSVSACKSSVIGPCAVRLPTRSSGSSVFHGVALPCANRSSRKNLCISKRRSTNVGSSFGAVAPSRSTASAFLGVGTPEVLVIGVVSLIVFGPKGLAEAARTLGQTLKAFQPTIRELQEVSNEFKSTLESEIGIDELRDTVRSTTRPPPRSPTTPPPSTGAGEGASFLEQDSTTGVPSDVVTPEMIEASKAAAWGGAAPAPAEAAPVSNADAVAAANATIKELSEQSNVVLNIPPELQAETPAPSAEPTPEAAAPPPSDTPAEDNTPPSNPPAA